ncbi:MAG: 3-hydroxy-5-phosphonooxypentane-2,4-dione thiolase [Deltaproteobacteria bacterium]|nr:MAG: 3-hydroxy-5-phosphonooxypentane-2,4-dione thiolase [Deltaproteobacteria bacterium]
MADAADLLDARDVSEMLPSEKPVPGTWIKGSDNLGWGMKNRLSRLIKPDGHCQFLPIDHGYFQGPTRCLERPQDTIRDLLPYADGLFVTRGVLRASIPADIETPIILRVSGGTSVVGKDLADEILTTSVEEMIRLNVAAVGLSIFVGTDYEKQTLRSLARLVDECETYGIPVMAVTAVGKELEKRTARYLALACRIAGELGARIVKTYYSAEDFDKVTNGCPVPIVIAGGPRCETEREVFDFVYDGMQKGAIGVNLGRNVWQHPHPVAMMKALNSIIHDEATPKQASELFESLKNE